MSNLTYREAGVDIGGAQAIKRTIKDLARATYDKNVLAGVGPFGALYDFTSILRQYHEPVLVFSADGVGTKLEIARKMGQLESIGEDLVNHCVNDIICSGAKPLVFLDYIAQDELRPQEIEDLLRGMARACREAGISLIGGETAQLPGLYRKSRFDVAGFIVGVAEKSKIISGQFIRPGDKILGLPSSGLHTNGYSLVRKIFSRRRIDQRLGQFLLAVHKSYLEPVSFLLNHRNEFGFYLLIHGIAHVTGGGLEENIERILPDNCQAEIQVGSWPSLPVFQCIQEQGNVSQEEMYRVFNMGIGMALIVSDIDLEEVRKTLEQNNQPVFLIGEIKEGPRAVILKGLFNL